MYRTGCFVIDGVPFKYEAKVFGVGSKFGIDDGRISKLRVDRKIGEDSWTTIIHYDRNWEIHPIEEIDKKALNYILNRYK